MNEGNNWQVNVTLTPDVAPIESRQGQPKNGFYTVRCTDATLYPAKAGKIPAIRMMLTIIESPNDPSEVGNTMSDWINLPDASQNDSKRATTQAFLKGTLIALGHDRDKVMAANGDIGLNRDSFVGKSGCMFYESYQGDGTRSYCTWLRAEHYAKGLSGEFSVKLRNPKTSSIDAPAPSAPTGFGGINVNSTAPVAPTTVMGNTTGGGAGDKIASLLA
jgi:hypothetical protein